MMMFFEYTHNFSVDEVAHEPMLHVVFLLRSKPEENWLGVDNTGFLTRGYFLLMVDMNVIDIADALLEATTQWKT